jgi:hypothetical protein
MIKGLELALITTNNKENFNRLIEKMRELGEDFYDDNECFIIPKILILKQDVKDGNCNFEKGTQFILVGGDTYLFHKYRFVGAFEDVVVGKSNFPNGEEFDRIESVDCPEKVDFEIDVYEDYILCNKMRSMLFNMDNKKHILYQTGEDDFVKTEAFNFYNKDVA